MELSEAIKRITIQFGEKYLFSSKGINALKDLGAFDKLPPSIVSIIRNLNEKGYLKKFYDNNDNLSVTINDCVYIFGYRSDLIQQIASAFSQNTFKSTTVQKDMEYNIIKNEDHNNKLDKGTFNNEEDKPFKFMGIYIEGTKQLFYEQLIAKGFVASKKFGNKIYTVKGKFAGRENCEIILVNSGFEATGDPCCTNFSAVLIQFPEIPFPSELGAVAEYYEIKKVLDKKYGEPSRVITPNDYVNLLEAYYDYPNGRVHLSVNLGNFSVNMAYYDKSFFPNNINDLESEMESDL